MKEPIYLIDVGPLVMARAKDLECPHRWRASSTMKDGVWGPKVVYCWYCGVERDEKGAGE